MPLISVLRVGEWALNQPGTYASQAEEIGVSERHYQRLRSDPMAYIDPNTMEILRKVRSRGHRRQK